MEPTLDSGVPDEVRAVFGLEGIKDCKQKTSRDNIHLECSPLWGPSPPWHLKCIDEEQMIFGIDDLFFNFRSFTLILK